MHVRDTICIHDIWISVLYNKRACSRALTCAEVRQFWPDITKGLSQCNSLLTCWHADMLTLHVGTWQYSTLECVYLTLRVGDKRGVGMLSRCRRREDISWLCQFVGHRCLVRETFSNIATACAQRGRWCEAAESAVYTINILQTYKHTADMLAVCLLCITMFIVYYCRFRACGWD